MLGLVIDKPSDSIYVSSDDNSGYLLAKFNFEFQLIWALYTSS